MLSTHFLSKNRWVLFFPGDFVSSFLFLSLFFFFWFRFLCGFVQWSKSSPRRRLDLFSLLSLSVLFSILCGLLRKRGEGKSAETKKSQERWCFRLRHLAVRFFKGFN